MKNSLRLLLASFLCALALLVPGGAVKADEYYSIDDYLVKVEVTKDHTYKVEERISANFKEYRHGIYRYIPYRFPNMPDLFPKIENLKVSDYPYTAETSEYNGYRFLDIRIGDADKTVIGQVEYRLSYDYLVGREPLSAGGHPSIRYNLMGNMETEINKASFEITLPEGVDAEQIRFYRGAVDSSEEAEVDYLVSSSEGRTIITGQLEGTLYGYEYLTFFVPVDDDYFSAAPVLKSSYQSWQPFLFAGVLMAMAGAGYLWFRFGRDRRIIGVVEFYPPEGLSPLEIHKIYQESDMQVVSLGEIKESTSLIYYLANKGYLKINFTGKKEFLLEQTGKDPSGEEKHIRVFLAELFKKSPKVGNKDLEQDYYDVGSATLAALPDHDIISGKSVFFKILGILMMAAPLALAFVGLFDHFLFGTAFFLIFPAAIGIILTLLFAYLLEKRVSGIAKGKTVYLVLLILSGMLPAWAVFGISGMMSLAALYLLVLLGMILSIFIKKRNDEAIMLLGRIKGFRDFIEVAKKNELEKLVADNPYYFYDVLPYAHVLGVSRVFAEKFKDIPIQVPLAYGGTDVAVNYWLLYYNLSVLNHMANSSFTAHQQMSRSGFGGGGGSFGGGGFSGGGFGGGGGGSW